MSVVSSVLSRVSTRSTGWRINVRLSSLMDSVFAIGFGLGLRFVVDTVSHHDFKLTGTLVGLWEGVILLHFLKKMPKSSDPYIAFGVRLFIDFIFTESIARMVLVLIWTALGMVLADITPAIWEDVGLKRVWNSFRRDLYTITRIIPTVAFFPPTRTVRFSPSREPSVIVDEATEVLSPSIGTTEQIPITNDDPLSSTAPRVLLKRRVPGYFPVDYSDTETDSSVRAEGFAPQGRTSRRLSVYPQIPDYDDSSASDLTTSPNDLDETNLSSDATETGEPPSALPDASEIPEIENEPLLVDIAAAVPVKPEEGELTPTQQQRQPYMPPTPSDSAARWAVNREIQEPLPVRPPSEFLPQIPDFLEEPASEDWENIQPADYSEEKPPTPPAKDKPVGIKIPNVPPVVQQQQPPQSTTLPDDEGWDAMESQILTRDANANEDSNANTTTNENTRRQSQPPPYDDYETHEDIYDDPPADTTTANANAIPTGNLIDNDDDTGVPPAHQDAFNAHNKPALLPPLPTVDPSLNPWSLGGDSAQQAADSGVDDFTAHLQRDVEAAQLKAKQEAEEAERKAAEQDARKAHEEEMKRIEEEIKKEEEKKKEEEAAAKKAEEERRAKEIEERKKKRAAEKAEREQKEKEDEIVRQKKREEEEAAEKLKQEEEKKRLKEEAEKKKAEQAAQKKKDAEEAKARRDQAAAKIAEEKRLKEEAKKAEEEQKRLKEEEVRKAAEAKKEAERLKAEAAAKEAEKAKEEAVRLQKEKEEEDAKKREDEVKAQAQAQANADALESVQDTQQNQEQEQGNGQTTEDAPTQVTKVAPAPEETTEDVKTPLARATDGDVDPPEQLLSPAKSSRPAPSEAADTASEASEAPPTNVIDRVERMLALRAQMVDTEATLQNLKKDGHDPNSPEVKQFEKILRKMQRRAERRYDAGIEYAQMLDKSDIIESDAISLDILNDIKSRQKIMEKIEQLLMPTSRSLYVKITMGKRTNDQKKQKAVITKLLKEYNLQRYCDGVKKTTAVGVSENVFAEWLTGYRVLSTQEQVEEPASLWD